MTADEQGRGQRGEPRRTLVPGARYDVSTAERRLAAAVHLSGLVTVALGPLGVLLLRGDRSTFVRDQAVQALNAALTAVAAILVSLLLTQVVVGFLLLPAVVVVHLVQAASAATRARSGVAHRYPLSLRLVR